MNRFDEPFLGACALVPGLLQSALVLLPEGLLIGGHGAESQLDYEPLARAAARCLGGDLTPFISAAKLVEYAFVSRGQLVVVQRGRRDERLALVTVCSREPNLQLVLSATRRAVELIEATIVLDDGARP